MHITITKSQKSTLINISLGATIIFLFWILVYLPTHKQTRNYQKQLNKVKGQLERVKNISEINRAITEGLGDKYQKGGISG